jgi:hypothetical protein
MFNFPRLGVVIAIGTFAVCFPQLSRQALSQELTNNSPVVWSEPAAKELVHALHHMHELVNEGKFDQAADMIVGDDVLMTFELSLEDNSTPIALRSKKELFHFMKQLLDSAQDNEEVTVFLDKPKHRARATQNLGIVTEECTVRFRYANGEERVDKLFGTNIAVKYPDGWKFIQWHMSVARPSKYFSNKIPIERLTEAN